MIKNLQLSNFRSYKEINIELSNKINVFIGNNGQGKTNLLEAIYFISNIRSHRSKNDKDLIKTNKDYARIIIENIEDDKKEIIVCVIHQKGKYFSINRNTIDKTSEMLGKINTVLFYPSETTLFSDSPSVRRIFFDVEIGKVSKAYTKNFQLFNNLLKDRNKLLKEDDVDLILLEILTNKLVDVQLEILKERLYLCDFINKYLNNNIIKLSKEELNINLIYESSIKNLNKEELIKKYRDNQRRDIFNKVTTEGIHRDDFKFYINDIEIDKFLSQGQIRIVLLALKFVFIQYIYEKTNKMPILLLDDVFSELDIYNQEKLINCIPDNVQTIITTIKNEEIFNKTNIKKYYIDNNKIVKEEE